MADENSVADQLDKIGKMQTQGFSFEDAKNAVEKGIGLVQQVTGDGSGGSNGSGGSSTSTSQQGLTQGCTVASVASELALGMRNPDGSITAKGREAGAPENCPADVLQKGLAEYRKNEGGGSEPMASPSMPPNPNNGASESPPVQATGLPMIPDEATRNLPASFDINLPKGWIGWLGGVAKMLVNKLGQSGANASWSALGALLGRRVSEHAVDEKKVPLLIEELPDWYQKPIKQWQAGFDYPMGCSDRQENVFLAMVIATSSYDMETGTQSKCIDV